MKILVTSYVFYPVTGGISTSTYLLSRELTRLGHEVRIVTNSRDAKAKDESIGKIIRDPSWLHLIRQILWCDVLLSIHLSVRLAWPLLIFRRPWVVAHHSWIVTVKGTIGWIEKIKRRLIRQATCISVSRAVAAHVDVPSVVIGPPYDDAVFQANPAIARQQDLLFVGRLVSSKGVEVLLQALAKLRACGLQPALNIVGDGPESAKLRELSRTLDLDAQVHFLGARFGAELRDTFSAHRILIMPSITPETFGIVAIEAIACGCVVVGSDEAGGLSDAIDSCGPTFQTSNPDALAECLHTLLSRPEELARYRENAAPHAAQFTAHHVAEQYLKIIEKAVATKHPLVAAALLAGCALPFSFM